jgi:hypothetical protein
VSLGGSDGLGVNRRLRQREECAFPERDGAAPSSLRARGLDARALEAAGTRRPAPSRVLAQLVDILDGAPGLPLSPPELVFIRGVADDEPAVHHAPLGDAGFPSQSLVLLSIKRESRRTQKA